MSTRVFVPLDMLAHWMKENRVGLDGDAMILRVHGQRFRLFQAFLFCWVEGGEDDRIGLVGRALTEEELEDLGAELRESSITLGQTAYRVEDGFISVPLGEQLGDEALVTEKMRRTFPLPVLLAKSALRRADITAPYYPIRRSAAHKRRGEPTDPVLPVLPVLCLGDSG